VKPLEYNQNCKRRRKIRDTGGWILVKEASQLDREDAQQYTPFSLEVLSKTNFVAV
jgi:hypothetical protein